MSKSISQETVFEKVSHMLNILDYRDPYKDHKAKKLTTGSMISLLIEAQLNRRKTLEDISENLRANEGWQNMLQLKEIHPSSLYRKLEKLDVSLLHRMAIKLLEETESHIQQKPDLHKGNIGPLHLIDGSEFSLSARDKGWAYAQKNNTNVKLHMCYVVNPEKEEMYAKDMVISTAGYSEKEMAKDHLVIDQTATYVFDRGYISYHQYHDWDQKNINYVARVQKSVRYNVQREHPVLEGSKIVQDTEVTLWDNKKKVDFDTRLVIFKDEKGKFYHVVTNRWDLTAEEIAEVYRNRWNIEVFFKWLKQNFHTISFYNHKPEAVWIQIYTAIIAYGIFKKIQREEKEQEPDAQLLRKLRHYWFKPWSMFIDALKRKPTKTSKGRVKKRKKGRPRKHPIVYKQKRLKSI